MSIIWYKNYFVIFSLQHTKLLTYENYINIYLDVFFDLLSQFTQCFEFNTCENQNIRLYIVLIKHFHTNGFILFIYE